MLRRSKKGRYWCTDGWTFEADGRMVLVYDLVDGQIKQPAAGWKNWEMNVWKLRDEWLNGTKRQTNCPMDETTGGWISKCRGSCKLFSVVEVTSYFCWHFARRLLVAVKRTMRRKRHYEAVRPSGPVRRRQAWQEAFRRVILGVAAASLHHVWLLVCVVHSEDEYVDFYLFICILKDNFWITNTLEMLLKKTGGGKALCVSGMYLNAGLNWPGVHPDVFQITRSWKRNKSTASSSELMNRNRKSRYNAEANGPSPKF